MLLNITILQNGSLFAQKSSIKKNDITGYIKDANSGEALPYANILIKGTNRGTITNTDGYFVLVNVPVGLCSLQVNYRAIKCIL